jgi:hypothetical protein
MGDIVCRIFLHVKQDVLEQLGGLFDNLVRPMSLRKAQGLGLDKTLDEMSTKLARV